MTAADKTITTEDGQGWLGLLATAGGGVLMTQSGRYNVAVSADYAHNSGLPLDPVTGEVECNTTGSDGFDIAGIPLNCQTLNGINVTTSPIPCALAGSITATIDFQATGTNLGPGPYEWDFGDMPPGNTLTTMTPSAQHVYSAPGSFLLKVKIPAVGNCMPRDWTSGITIDPCPTRPPPTTGSLSCAILLWVSLIVMLVGAVVSLVGCILAHWFPQAGLIVGIIGVALFLLGALLFLIWWIVCRFLTLCAVILAARDFVRVLIAIFAVIAIVLAIIAWFGIPAFWPCAGMAAVYGFAWGGVLAMLDFIADSVGCLIRNPSGGSSSASSSSGLTDAAQEYRLRSSDFMQRRPATAIVGLGDMVSSVALAMGVQPCRGCVRRADMLNRRFPLAAGEDRRRPLDG